MQLTAISRLNVGFCHMPGVMFMLAHPYRADDGMKDQAICIDQKIYARISFFATKRARNVWLISSAG